MSAQVAADLRAAAEVLRRDGWTQGSYHSDDGCHCALGAIAVAIRGTSKPNPDRWKPWAEGAVRLRADAEVVARLIGFEPDAHSHPRLDVSDWNDDPDRSADEVIAALEAAADAAERKAAYDEGRWCGECQYGVVMDPPCCTQGPARPQSGDQ